MKLSDPDDHVRTTSALARRLRVTRRSINNWRHDPDAPRRTAAGLWHIPSWVEYLHKHRLAQSTWFDRTQAAAEIYNLAQVLLPGRMRRRELQNLLAAVEACAFRVLRGVEADSRA